MASQKTKFSVGVFVASGVCIVVVAIIWLGMSRYLQKGNFYVSYFDESVQGLQKGAPVKYRGVSVGRVESIGVAPDDKLIQVVMKVETGQTLTEDMVAQLRDVGLTGSMFVELDRREKGETFHSPQITFPSEYPIVPSKPSEMQKLLGSIDAVVRHIKSLDLKGISDKVKRTLDTMNHAISAANIEGLSVRVRASLDGIDKAIADAQIKAVSTKLQSSLDGADRLLNSKQWSEILTSIQKATETLNQVMDMAKGGMTHADNAFVGMERIVAENEKTIRGAIEQILEATKNANVLLERGSKLVNRSDDSIHQLRQELLVSAQNLAEATDNLNRFMEILAEQPTQLLLGEPPKPKVEFGEP